uniref:Transmembrane protein n=1 Tax=Medicago truncatula TaxID=3880 RepID=I3SZW7_MEDTR|nr:unknown [Medicago truncatula]
MTSYVKRFVVVQWFLRWLGVHFLLHLAQDYLLLLLVSLMLVMWETIQYQIGNHLGRFRSELSDR